MTERASLGPGSLQANNWSALPYPGNFSSSDGRFIAFVSAASNLVSGDTNPSFDIFVRDRLTGTTELIDLDSSGSQANGTSGTRGLCISSDGRYVVFESSATNLVPGDTNAADDLFLRDRLAGTTERVSVDSSGAQANSDSWYPSISADGRYVAFLSMASNLVPGDTNGFSDVFVRDRLNGTTELISVGLGGAMGNNDVDRQPSITPDGRYVAFASKASNLVATDSNAQLDVFVRDRQTATTELISLDSGGVQGNWWSYEPAISADGRLVAFQSAASNLVPGDILGAWDIFVRDRLSHTTECVSISNTGRFGDGDSGEPTISTDGRFVAFTSCAGNLCAGDTNNYCDGFVRDRLLGTTELVTVSTTGQQAVLSTQSHSISADGRYVVFLTDSPGLVPGDTNGVGDVFVHDRFATGFMSLCEPGGGGAVSCPCNNPPVGPVRGCDNSSFTGGATLSASGIAYLSIDSLSFTTSGEKPNATSILLQGDGTIPGGLVFGQGVRCAGGTLKRLFVKSAMNGSITAPDFAAGDPAVSARSAQLGLTLQPGQAYCYLVFYRDPLVLGGCSVTQTFNCTQSGRVSFWP